MEQGPHSLFSVYRGQSSRGIGEGPGSPIAHGEQYLKASDEKVEKDGELLEAIRPWMSLDSDPADHQRLGDRLEGWSCFPYRGRKAELQLVVRLVSAGTYDRRAAYFAHGRAWLLAAATPVCDPGLHLGRSEAFETPWRDNNPGERVVEPPPALVRPEDVAVEQPVAALFLGHLFQALSRQYPLVIATPVVDFLSGSRLHALVAFSRAALPSDLKPACRIRIYTRLPDLFLKHLQANLVVVPEETAGEALAARRDATLLDRQGNTRVGKELDPGALAYAEAVVERAVRLPQGLPQFTARFTERFRDPGARPALPSAEEARAVQITYNLAYALSGPEDQRADMLRSYLPKAATKYGPGLDWRRLIAGPEWRDFPHDALLDLLLLDSTALLPGARELQAAVEDALAPLGLKADPRLEDWWNAAEPWKLRRLLELLSHQPPLVSPQAAVERTSHLPIREIAAAGPPDGVLQIELEQGWLAHRAHESTELARLAHEPRIFDILSRAVAAGQLDTAWAGTYLDSASGATLLGAAKQFFGLPGFWDGWGDLPNRLLQRLQAAGSGLAGLEPQILKAGQQVDPTRHLEVFLRLTDLLSVIDEAGGVGTNLTRLWKAAPNLTNPKDREILVEAALGDGWKCLRPGSLLVQGGLRIPWLAEMADRLLAVDEIVETLAAPALVELGAKLREEASYERLYAILDGRMRANREEQEETTGALIRAGWWYFWRRRSQLSPDERREVARTWMTSEAWHEKGHEATWEAWELAASDLPADLDGAQMRELCGSGNRHVPGPAIPPFEEEQLADFEFRADGLGALAELAEAIRSDQRFQIIQEAHVHAIQGSRFAQLNPESFAWLIESRSTTQLRIPSLEDSAFLYKHAGHRQAKALQARIRSVAAWLDMDPQQALAAAGIPFIWDQPEFLAALGQSMCRKGSLAAIGQENLWQINQYASGTPARYPPAPPRRLMEEFAARHYDTAARLLSSAVYQQVQEETLAAEVIRALYNGAADEPCWLKLAAEIRQAQSPDAEAYARRHPLSLIAEQIREGNGLTRDHKRLLAERGWRTFEEATYTHPALLASGEWEILPAFELAASLLGPGAVGNAALLVIFTAGNRGNRSNVDWWRALLRGIRCCRRRGNLQSPDDREEDAVALISKSTEGFESYERARFQAALGAESR